MPLVTDYQAVKDVYQEVREAGAALPVFCAEDRETMEAILAATVKTGAAIGRDDLPVIIAWTGRYPGRSQVKLVAACGDPILGMELMLSDLAVFMSGTSPYRNVRVLPHLDHAFPWFDGDLLDGYADRMASVMCDASEKPFEENIRLTARYVEKMKGRVVIEGAVDEVFEAGGTEKNEVTSPEQAVRFLRETGVDIIVPNVGTEHRATSADAHYHSEKARLISAAVGRILCLHGTSSARKEDLSLLPGDGFIKINIYTTLAIAGGQAVAGSVLENLGNIFDESRLRELHRRGVLGEKVFEPGYGGTIPPIKPKLVSVTNPSRRDAWFAAVRNRCCDFFDALNYRAFAR